MLGGITVSIPGRILENVGNLISIQISSCDNKDMFLDLFGGLDGIRDV